MSDRRQEGNEEIPAVVQDEKIIDHREAFKRAIETFQLSQAEICRRATFLEMWGQGRAIGTAQLSRWLQGKKDLEIATLQTLELTLAFPPDVGAFLYYQQLLMSRDMMTKAAKILKEAGITVNAEKLG